MEEGAGEVLCAGAGDALAGGSMPGGYHPPPEQTQSAPGRGVEQAVEGAGGGGGADGAAPGTGMPGGNHPPLAQVQPAPGGGVRHPDAGEDEDAGATVGVRPGTGMPGGNQPPLAQVHPAPGGGVRHPDADEDEDAGATVGVRPGSGMSGGYQPPLAQIHPGPGFGVVHSPGGAGEASRFWGVTRERVVRTPATSVARARIAFNFKRVAPCWYSIGANWRTTGEAPCASQGACRRL